MMEKRSGDARRTIPISGGRPCCRLRRLYGRSTSGRRAGPPPPRRDMTDGRPARLAAGSI